MPTCAEVLARTLREAGVTRMFGLPGGEILDFIEAARNLGIEFLLTRDEATAAFMADVTGQMQRLPGVCVSTLGPGAMNMALGVANGYLDRSPMIAITASMSMVAAPYATHQNLDLNAVYSEFTKGSVLLDGRGTARKVAELYRLSLRPRMGPVHIALPSDVAKAAEAGDGSVTGLDFSAPGAPQPDEGELAALVEMLRRTRQPVVVIGLDLDPTADSGNVRRFVEQLGAPCFVTPKAKGVLPEDHPLFLGVCAGVAGDSVIVELLEEADYLIGLGFEPVENDKLWHHTLKLISITPMTIAWSDYSPYHECVGDFGTIMQHLEKAHVEPKPWPAKRVSEFRSKLDETLRPRQRPTKGLSPYEVTLRLRELLPRDTICVTDVGSIKSVTTQGWRTYEPLTFFESNGLSSMGYGFPGAMAVKLLHPERPVVCTVGDGGFGMTLADLETCVRRGLNFVTVVYNDSSLSLIRVAQEYREYPNYGVDYGSIDFAVVAAGFGAWSRRIETMDQLDEAVTEGLKLDRPVVLDVTVDLAEYRAHNAPLVRADASRTA